MLSTEEYNATAAKHAMSIAASWGRKWGAMFGALKANFSGKMAGALAGKEAGAEAGAKAGAAAAAAAAKKIATKYLSQMLSFVNSQVAQGNTFNIYTNCSRRDAVPLKREDILREAFCNVQKDKLIKPDDQEIERDNIATLSGLEKGSSEAETELSVWKKVLQWIKSEEKNYVQDKSDVGSENMEFEHEETSWKNAATREQEELEKALFDFQKKKTRGD